MSSAFAKNPDQLDTFQIHSLVEAANEDGNKVSSINSETRYKEILHDFSPKEKEKIIQYIEKIWNFWIGRIGLKANHKKDIIEWKFEIFENKYFCPSAPQATCL